MDILIMIAQLILGLTILVVVHEWGHYITAKSFGMRVEKFYLFFDAWGKKLFSITKNGTEYGIGWLPLGGYVKISGMIDESMDKEFLNRPPEPYEFRAKPAWQRLIVMIGGVVMNIILGVAIFTMYLQVFEKQYLTMDEVNKDGIFACQSAKDIGLQTGDKIIALNGSKPDRFKEIVSSKIILGGTITVNRNGQTIDVKVPNDFYKRMKEPFVATFKETVKVDQTMLGSNAEKAGLQRGDQILAINNKTIDRFDDVQNELKANLNGKVQLKIKNAKNEEKVLNADVTADGKLGFMPNIDVPYAKKPYSLISAFKFGCIDGYELLATQLLSFKLIFSGKVNATDAVSGPIGIAKIYGNTWDWGHFWQVTGLLSFVLAFMNILPIPALDGGHVVFLLIEMVTRRKISETILEKAQIVGFILLMGLMLFAFGNDIFKLF